MPRASGDRPSADRPVRILRVDPRTCRSEELRPAAQWLQDGGIVAFPTDTFYGLGVDPSSAFAVRQLFDLKGREPRAALPLVAGSTRQVEAGFGRLGSAAARLAARFWPGPLSLVLDAPASVTPEAHAGRRSIAIRVPAHTVARELCSAFGGPVTATSANYSGAPPARLAGDLDALADDPRVLVIDAGPAPGGLPSTIVDVRDAPPLLIRAGAIPWDQVLAACDSP